MSQTGYRARMRKSITVLGGSGYTGSAIVQEAASRGFAVTAISRTAPAERVDGVTYLEADATADDTIERALDADVVIGALAPRESMAGRVEPTYAALAAGAAETGTRLVLVGGWSSLRPEAGAPRFSEGDVDPRFVDEAREMVRVLDALQAGPAALDWVFVSPALLYGSYAPQEATGTYRLGGDVALTAKDGPTTLGAADFAKALVDLADGGTGQGHVSVAS